MNSFHETFWGRIFIFIFSHQEKAPIMYICHINYFKDQYILQINISTHLITQEELCGKNYKSVTICKADNKLKRGYLIQVMHDSRKYLFHPWREKNFSNSSPLLHPWRKKPFLRAPHYSNPHSKLSFINFFQLFWLWDSLLPRHCMVYSFKENIYFFQDRSSI